jgi:hypothetical protein
LVPVLLAAPAASEETTPGDGSWVRATAAVDAHIDARLAEEGVRPAARSDDSEYLRRVYLDVVGTVPTADEVESFLADRSPDKRAKVLEVLLAGPAYADYWATWWFRTLTGITGATLKGGGQGLRLLRGENGDTFREWLHLQMEKNRPYDEFASDLISATGRTDENGATGLYARWEGKPNDLAGSVARTFLGVRIQCAQCHDHVYEPEWKQKDFQGMAAFFATSFPRRVEMEAGAKGRYAAEVTDFEMPERARGRRALAQGKELPEELKQRFELAGVTPKFWMGSEAKDLPGVPRRMLLARWVAAEENPYFARALVNRYFEHFFGRGFVTPVDDFGSFNTPSHPELLDTLARDFASSGFDLKRLVRVLVRSEGYQRTSRWTGEEPPDPSLFARAPVRPLSTEQLFLSLGRASGLERRLDAVSRRQGREARQGFFTAFSFVFDDDEMAESEDFQGSIPQGLFLMNDSVVQTAVSARVGTTVAEVLRSTDRESERIRRLYLSAFAREPDATEANRALAVVRRGDGTQGYEDLFWALLNSAEFTTNH